MMAKVEKKDGSYELLDIGSPICGEDVCDLCGDCIACYIEDRCGGDNNFSHSWVIYIDNKKNPYFTKGKL